MQFLSGVDTRNKRRAPRWGTGVRPAAGGKWQARITIDGQERYLGTYSSQRKAQLAADHTARELTRRELEAVV